MKLLTGFAWWNNPAYLSLLTRFLSPQPISRFSLSPAWQTALKEDPLDAVQLLYEEGLLAPATLAEQLAYRYGHSDLAEMVEARGLRVAGSKTDLITCLLRFDLKGMQEKVAHLGLLHCSEVGERIAARYLEQEEAHHERAEQQCLAALRTGQLERAVQLVLTYELGRVFPFGVESDLSPNDILLHLDPARDVAVLQRILQGCPTRAARLSHGQIDQVRIAAAMRYLWGTESAER